MAKPRSRRGSACAAVDVGRAACRADGGMLYLSLRSFDQGLIAFRHILHFLQHSFEKHGVGAWRGRFRIQNSANRATITGPQDGRHGSCPGERPYEGFIRRGAKNSNCLDEIAQWPPERVEPMLAALKTSRGKIPDSRALWIGTRPSMPDHPFQRALDGRGRGLRAFIRCEERR